MGRQDRGGQSLDCRGKKVEHAVVHTSLGDPHLPQGCSETCEMGVEGVAATREHGRRVFGFLAMKCRAAPRRAPTTPPLPLGDPAEEHEPNGRPGLCYTGQLAGSALHDSELTSPTPHPALSHQTHFLGLQS